MSICKCTWLVLGVSFAGLAAEKVQAQPDLQVLQRRVEVREVMEVGKNFIRIAKHPTTGELFYLGINGLIFVVEVETGTSERLYAWPDHGVRIATGFTIAADGTFFWWVTPLAMTIISA